MRLLIVMTILICSACSQRIKVPINRMHTPEVLGGGFHVDGRQVGQSQGVMDFSGDRTTNPLVMTKSSDREFFMALGVADNVDLFLKVPNQSSSLVGIKIQVMGENAKVGSIGNTLAFTLGFGSERDKFDSTFTINLKSDVSDYSLIHGYRFNKYISIYDGISLSNYSFEGTISGATTLDSDNLEYEARNILGAFGGIILGTREIQLKIEYAMQKIQWSHSEEKLFQSVGTSFGVAW